MSTTVNINNIHVDDASNYRSKIDPTSLKELHQSYVSIYERTKGARWMLNPVDVIQLEEPIDGKEYQLRFGFRRYHAAKFTMEKSKHFAWACEVPVTIMDASIADNPGAWLLMALAENLQREDTSPLDEARACQKALKSTGMTLEQLGNELGKSKGWVSQRMSLLKLAPAVQAALSEDTITFAHARELCRLDSEEQQEKMLDVMDMNDWDVRETKRHVSGLKDGNPTPQTQFIYDGHEVPEKPEKAPASDKPKARKMKALLTQMSSISERFEGIQKERTEALDENKEAYGREAAFYAGAQAAMDFALGRSEDVAYAKEDTDA